MIGYDRSHDITLLQLQGASGLQTASIGDSSNVAVGDEIAAIGNAGGRGGTPSIAGGTVSALDQTVTVSDDSTGSSEQLAGLIQVAANVQPGDSGGPLVNATGQVIGVNTAGSAGSQLRPSSAEGLAIPIAVMTRCRMPINDAIAISTQIQAGSASATIHIGPTGILGVLVQGPNTQAGPGRHGRFRIRHRPAVSGTPIAGVAPGSPAEQSGLTTGDVIVSLDGAAVDSPSTLTTLLSAHHPETRCSWPGWIPRASSTPPQCNWQPAHQTEESDDLPAKILYWSHGMSDNTVTEACALTLAEDKAAALRDALIERGG